MENEKLRKRLIEKTGGDILKCFSCGKCAASCPVSQFLDFNPRRVIRKAALGADIDEDFWPCVSCFTCNARCPNGIDIARAMNILRIEAQKDKKTARLPGIIFARAFLESVEKNGRLYELGMLAKYKIKSGRLLDDVEFGPPLMLKGKMGLLPHKSKNAKAVGEIFRRVREIDARGEK